MLSITALDHLVLRVRDIQTMLDFYQNVLGCELERKETALGLYQLRAGTALIDLVPVDSPLGQLGGRSPEREGHNLDHFCVRLAPFDPEVIIKYLQQHRVVIGETAPRYGSQGHGVSIYVEDPEGNKIELKGEKCSNSKYSK